ncbi:hypothetical protein B0J13DRAFT_676472 [Dactylonectria estremocensis]|uniref:Uncharacterized protein n=1 Tax=Dactylonectria estremocensis TaxID=1079267 RepID=A0A9P9EPG0_9HYPO|nr:hypothetical protein B0J13DRAFT_676472 [Dactylonectria estremocensis]
MKTVFFTLAAAGVVTAQDFSGVPSRTSPAAAVCVAYSATAASGTEAATATATGTESAPRPLPPPPPRLFLMSPPASTDIVIIHPINRLVHGVRNFTESINELIFVFEHDIEPGKRLTGWVKPWGTCRNHSGDCRACLAPSSAGEGESKGKRRDTVRIH